MSLLAACGTSSMDTRQNLPPLEPVPAPAPEPPAPLSDGGEVRLTTKGRWVRSDWTALPGWQADSVRQAWPALWRSCERVLNTGLANRPVTTPARPAAVPTATTARPDPAALLNGNGAVPAPAPGYDTASAALFARHWSPTCRAVRALGPNADENTARDFLTSRLQPWRVESAEGRADGMMTGYFEPLVEASRVRSERHAVPLHGVPADLALRQPWYSRTQIDTLPEAQAALAGREIAWVADPLEALMLQIQGSGRLVLAPQGPAGERRVVRVAFAAHNGQPYQSVGRWLVDQGAFTLEQASWPAIRQWARQNPQRVREMLQANPRYVFFREEALPDPNVGALGAQGVPLTPGRSIAVDRDSIPYGTPVWLASTEPQPWSLNPPPARPMQRLVVAQDTGSAILGAVRADFFWGWGDGIEDRAGRTKQPLRLWVLWPR
ncbi:murein transglycosylase A [Sphaerotilus hippei]|uniref:murein transglycosylase A n=1 Tax=Sphaerotilus hippei TaxID=744406 RepID=UPI001FEC8B19|nr:MltA domain-containing protein [Sphaerotilus hippei]